MVQIVLDVCQGTCWFIDQEELASLLCSGVK